MNKASTELYTVQGIVKELPGQNTRFSQAIPHVLRCSNACVKVAVQQNSTIARTYLRPYIHVGRRPRAWRRVGGIGERVAVTGTRHAALGAGRRSILEHRAGPVQMSYRIKCV